MYLEFQTRTAAMIGMVRERLRQRLPSIPGVFAGADIELAATQSWTRSTMDLGLRMTAAPASQLPVLAERIALHVRHAMFRRCALIDLPVACAMVEAVGRGRYRLHASHGPAFELDTSNVALPVLVPCAAGEHRRDQAVRVGKLVATLHGDHVALHAAHDRNRELGRIAVRDARGISPARGGRGFPSLFVATGDEGGHVYDLRDPRTPREIARYARDPWYAGAATIGRLTVKLVASQRLELLQRVWEDPR